jgi:hypothetical protein
MKQWNDAVQPSYGINDLDDCGFKDRPIAGKEFGGQDQHGFSAGLNAFTQFVNPVAASVLGENPFIKPDLEPVIAETACQIFRPGLLSTFVAKEDVVLEVACGHAFWLAGVWRKYTRLLFSFWLLAISCWF